jgi:hypothetical protein
MVKAAGQILKADEVKLEGQFHLDVGPMRTPMVGQKATNPALSAPKVCIVENHPEFAVIEVTCCCGMKTNLKCEYAGSRTPVRTKVQNPDLVGTVSG